MGLIGSCTNSSYEDLSRASSIANQALEKNLSTKAEFGINPGSEQVRYTAERDGFKYILKNLMLKFLLMLVAHVLVNGQEKDADKEEKNSIVHSFNRNFAKRADGNPNTHAFVASPEMVAAIAISGNLAFNPMKDKLTNDNGENRVSLDEPKGWELPPKGFDVEDNGYIDPVEDGSSIEVELTLNSERLKLLNPFEPWDGKNIEGAKLLIKAQGKCTTDHISMAGPWLRFRGHLDNISNNCLIGAVNAFNKKTNYVKNQLTGEIWWRS